MKQLKWFAKVLHPHFLKEEEYAVPSLGLLPVLAEGKTAPDMKAVVNMTNRLKADLNHMLLEHKQICWNFEEFNRSRKGSRARTNLSILQIT